MHGPSLEIRLLGRLEVVRDSHALDLPRSRKARALLAYLAATGRAHGREHLCDLLWESPADPRAALRGALSKLRPLLDDPQVTRLVTEGDHVSLQPRDMSLDVAEVRATAARLDEADLPTLERAAARFRGPFLEGLGMPRCYRFEAWCTAEREVVRRLRASLLSALSKRLGDDPDKALRYARERLLLDPCDEAANLEVMRWLAALGRTREALEQYDACRRVLRRQLGVAPSAELEALRRQIVGTAGNPATTGAVASRDEDRADPPREEARAARTRHEGGDTPRREQSRVAPPRDQDRSALPQQQNRAAPRRPKPDPRPPPAPLVGRRRERRAMEGLIERAAGGTAQLLWLLGAPGIGKTRLLEELHGVAHKAGFELLAGRTYEAELIRPYGAWIDVLRDIPAAEIPASPRSELALLLPELGPAPPDAADRSRLFDAIARLLEGRCAQERPLAIILDDVQWIDEASAALLHFLARQLPDARLLIACASRGAELEDNRAAARLLRALRREGALSELAVGPLEPSEVADLVRHIDPGRNAERIFDESAGNPLFALELARTPERPDAPLSGTLADLIDDRLDQLVPEARALVQWAAAIGHDFDLPALALAADLPASELLRSIEDLERRGIVRVAGSRYDFTHDLIRRAAYQRIAGPRRRLMHLRIAQALRERDDPGQELAGELARHAALGGDDESAARAFLTAARRALWTFASREAAELAALGMAHADKLRQEVRLELQIELLGLSVYPGMREHRVEGVEAELTRAIAEARAAGLTLQMQRGFQLLGDLHFLNGDFGSALDGSLRAQEAGRAADPATVVRAIADTARCLGILEREMDRAERLACEAEALAEGTGYVGHELPQALGYVHHHAGRLDDAIACFERAARLAQDERARWFQCACLSRLVMIELERASGEALRRAEELLTVTRPLGEGSDGPFAEALGALGRLQADEQVATGDQPGETEPSTRLESALATLRDADSRWMTAYVQNVAGTLDLERGRVDEARRRAEEALESASIAGRSNEIAVARALLARVLSACGDGAGAAAQLDAIREGPARIAGGLSLRARRAIDDAAATLDGAR